MVDFAVKTGGYDIGFRKNENGIFEIVCDWWGVKNITDKTACIASATCDRMLTRHLRSEMYYIVFNQKVLKETERE